MRYRCTGCNSTGFALSRLGIGRCEFCDGTEGGNPPTDDEIEEAIIHRQLVAIDPGDSAHAVGVTLSNGRSVVRPASRTHEWASAKAWGRWMPWRNYDGRWGVNGWVRALIQDVHSPLEPVYERWNVIY